MSHRPPSSLRDSQAAGGSSLRESERETDLEPQGLRQLVPPPRGPQPDPARRTTAIDPDPRGREGFWRRIREDRDPRRGATTGCVLREPYPTASIQGRAHLGSRPRQECNWPTRRLAGNLRAGGTSAGTPPQRAGGCGRRVPVLRAVSTRRRAGGKLAFERGTPPIHILFGYLEIGEVAPVVENTCQDRPWTATHPHVKVSDGRKNNTLYIAAKASRLAPGRPDAGLLRYSEETRLTKAGEPPSTWRLPSCFASQTGKPSYHAVEARGQESQTTQSPFERSVEGRSSCSKPMRRSGGGRRG